MVKVKNHQIFLTFLKIGTIGFGGGNAAIPLFHKEVIDRHHWMEDEAFSDMLAIANTLPGPTQTKLAGYIGYQLKGFLGMIFGLLGIILPSLLLMSFFLNWIYKNSETPWMFGLTHAILPVILVMMGSLTWQFFSKSNKSLGILNNSILLMIGFVFLVIFKIHPAFLIIIILISAFLPKINDLKRFLFIFILSLLVIIIIKFQLSSIQNLNLINLKFNTNIKYFQIFLAFSIPGIIGYGGGPASVTLVEYEVIQHFQLISPERFDLAFAVQATLPGVTATKLAGYIGFVSGDILGAFIGIFAYVAPSLILMITLLGLLNKYKTSPVVKRLTTYVTPTVTILLGMLAFRFLNDSYSQIGWLQTLGLSLISIILLVKYRIHPLFVIILAMVYGSIFIR